MGSDDSGRTQKVVGLFLAASLTLLPGCSLNPFSSQQGDSFCADENNDGYCDQDGRPVQGGRTSYFSPHYWWGGSRFGGGGNTSVTTGASNDGAGSRGISTGSKSGIGSSARSGGSSGG
jgi:hypothetical protein